MAGKGNAVDMGETDAIGKFEEDEAEGDGQAFAVVEDVAEVAVGAVVVIVTASVETIFFEEESAQGIKAAGGIQVGGELGAEFAGEGVELTFVDGDVEFGIVESGDEEGGVGETDLGFGPGEFADEIVPDLIVVEGGGQLA